MFCARFCSPSPLPGNREQNPGKTSCCSSSSTPRSCFDFVARPCRQDRGGWFRRGAAPLAQRSVSARSSPNTSSTAGRRSPPCRLERLRAHRALYLKRFKGETNMQLLLLLDASASMTYGSGKRSQAGLCPLYRGLADLHVLAAARRHGADRLRSRTCRITCRRPRARAS